MRHLLITLLVGLMSFGLAVDHAEAKRFGGGKSFGSYSRSASPSNNATNRATTPPRQATQPNRGGASRFLGPLAGIMAGGLLASLLFGGAFDGIRFMDILLIALVAFIAFRFLRRRREATAGAHDRHYRDTHTDQHNTQAFEANRPATGSGGTTVGNMPSWFNKEHFLTGAKEHFMTLQRAWDNNDLSRMQEYVTPELYNLLRQERAAQPANNRTEIIRLFAELGNIQEIGQQAEATVLFHGLLKEEGQETEFNETWHLVRELKDGAPWYIQGIEQNS